MNELVNVFVSPTAISISQRLLPGQRVMQGRYVFYHLCNVYRFS